MCSTRLIVDVYTLISDIANSFIISFLVVLGFSLTFRTKICSSLVVNLRLRPERCNVSVEPKALYLQIIVCTEALGVCNCFEMAPNDKPDL